MPGRICRMNIGGEVLWVGHQAGLHRPLGGGGMQRGEDREQAEEARDHEMARTAIQAAAQTAEDLVGRGFDEARADGPHVYAQKGRYRFLLRNDVRPGPPGRREEMINLYASLAARNLLRRLPGPGTKEGGRHPL